LIAASSLSDFGRNTWSVYQKNFPFPAFSIIIIATPLRAAPQSAPLRYKKQAELISQGDRIHSAFFDSSSPIRKSPLASNK
jgi:hypothetical protein